MTTIQSLVTSKSTHLDAGAEQHSLAKSVLLHLAPGAVVTLVYILLTPPLLKLGLPNLLTLNLAAILVLVPLELWILLAEGKKKNGHYSLHQVVLYRERIPLWQLIGLAFGLMVWMAACFALLAPRIDPLVQKALFGWVPAWFPLMATFTGYPKNVAVLTLAVSLVCTSWIAPFVEEYYFRGYLLPRLSRFGRLAPLINVALFSLYHFFTPWQALTRILAVTPMAWVVMRKRNLYIGIVAHLALNTISLLPALLRIMGK
jgi:membrane protease YdiL (CAAX protease family)